MNCLKIRLQKKDFVGAQFLARLDSQFFQYISRNQRVSMCHFVTWCV